MMVSDYRDDEIDIFGIFQSLIKNRGKIVAFLLVSLFIMGGLYSAYLSKVGNYRYVLDEIRVSLEFSGATERRYPSGLKFSPTDFISNDILRTLYEKYNLKELGSFDSFIGAFSASYVIELSDTEEDANDKNKDKNKVIDYSRVVIQMTSRAENGGGQSFLAQIQQSDRDKILSDIPRLWSDNFKKYHLSYTTFNSAKLIDVTNLNKKDYWEVRRMLEKSIDPVVKNIKILSESFPLSAFRSKKYGLTLKECLFKLDELMFAIKLWSSEVQGEGLFRNPQKAKRNFQKQLIDAERKKGNLERTYDATISVLSENYSPLSISGSLTAVKKSNNRLSPTAVKQADSLATRSAIDPEAYNHIYKLALNSQNFSYKNRLTDRLITLSGDISEAEYDIEEIKYNLKLVEGSFAGGDITTPSSQKIIDEKLSLLVGDFKRLVQVGSEVADEYFSLAALRYGEVATLSSLFSTKMVVLPEGKKLFKQMLLFPLVANAVLFIVFLGYIVLRDSYEKYQNRQEQPNTPDGRFVEHRGSGGAHEQVTVQSIPDVLKETEAVEEDVRRGGVI